MPHRQYSTPRHFTDLGTFLRSARHKAQLTQRQASLELGYSSAQFISNFESGIVAPPTKKLKVLKKLYKFQVSKAITLQLEGERRKILAGLEE